jgi:general stress protein YciG
MSKRGFAMLKETNPERFFEVCSRGGRRAHATGKTHQWNHEEALAAGRRGGLSTAARKRDRQLRLFPNEVAS